MSSEWRKQTKARKSHQCEICRGEIVPGEIYVRYTPKFENCNRENCELIECCACEPRPRPCYECGAPTTGGKFCSRSCWVSAVGAGDE